MNCYITYLCNDNYLPGIVALVKSLKYHKTKNQIFDIKKLESCFYETPLTNRSVDPRKV